MDSRHTSRSCHAETTITPATGPIPRMFDEEPEPEPTLDQVRMVWRRWSINVFEGHENEVVSECRLGGDNQAQLRILEAWSVVHIPAQTHTHTHTW